MNTHGNKAFDSNTYTDMNTEPTYSNCCGAQMPQAEGERCPRCGDHCAVVLSDNAKWSEAGPDPRNPYRRKIDTEDRLDWFRSTNATSRLPRMAILCAGLEVLDRDCKVAAHDEVWESLRRVFSPNTTHA